MSDPTWNRYNWKPLAVLTAEIGIPSQLVVHTYAEPRYGQTGSKCKRNQKEKTAEKSSFKK